MVLPGNTFEMCVMCCAGLKLGLLISAEASGAFPGSRGHEEGDAEQYVDWGIDLLLYQAAATDTLVEDCRAMRAALDATGGSFVFALSSSGTADPWLWDDGVRAFV
jgi:alpha-galactosidase